MSRRTHALPTCYYMDSDLPRHGPYWIHGTECDGHGKRTNQSNTIQGEVEAIQAESVETEEDRKNDYERRG